MPLAVLWTIRSATGHIIECQLNARDDHEDGDVSVHLTLVRDGETILSEWFTDHEAAIERTIRLYRQLKHAGWQE
jgi:hypothetical protein